MRETAKQRLAILPWLGVITEICPGGPMPTVHVKCGAPDARLSWYWRHSVQGGAMEGMRKARIHFEKRFGVLR
jgi:hypothetical protein